jgi:hypothetical protein
MVSLFYDRAIVIVAGVTDNQATVGKVLIIHFIYRLDSP